jgi:betaine-aldehyde dehydrogenase
MAVPPLSRRSWRPFIAGAFVAGHGQRLLLDPASGGPLGTVSEGDREQAEAAVRAARRAFDHGAWPRLPGARRAKELNRLAERLEAMAEDLAMTETRNQGKPLRESRADLAEALQCLRYYARLATRRGDEPVTVGPRRPTARVLREPIGVCALITAWNYPLLLAVWKLAPALAAGNTCVLKPSELTPLTSLLLAQAVQDLDWPPGVVNVVPGAGPAVGRALAESPRVDKVSFTGSAATGRQVAAAALGNLKRVALDLGGKSPVIVFADQDLEAAVAYALFAAYCNAGQVCSAGSRVLVEASIHDRFVRRLAERAGRIAVGPGTDPGAEMGPLVSASQLHRVREYVRIGVGEGARLEAGGRPLTGGPFGGGFFLEPTLFSGGEPWMRVVQEEIFGPVAVVQRFTTERQAVELANGTPFGLAGAVFSGDLARAVRVARALRAGITWVNSYHTSRPDLPWGGCKQSGWGRELGTFGLDACTEVKQFHLVRRPPPLPWFRP